MANAAGAEAVRTNLQFIHVGVILTGQGILQKNSGDEISCRGSSPGLDFFAGSFGVFLRSVNYQIGRHECEKDIASLAEV